MENLEQWEERFEKELIFCEDHFNCVHQRENNVRNFIRSLLSTQSQQLKKEFVEEMRKVNTCCDCQKIYDFLSHYQTNQS